MHGCLTLWLHHCIHSHASPYVRLPMIVRFWIILEFVYLRMYVRWRRQTIDIYIGRRTKLRSVHIAPYIWTLCRYVTVSCRSRSRRFDLLLTGSRWIKQNCYILGWWHYNIYVARFYPHSELNLGSSAIYSKSFIWLLRGNWKSIIWRSTTKCMVDHSILYKIRWYAIYILTVDLENRSVYITHL